MTEIKKINQIWLKGSIIGSLWASSEIVLGSFLHNLRIPFAGSILSAIAIIIIISFSYIWKEKGLFWRAGLIAALMKTLSPSAVIFGPMVAIFMVGVIMDFTTRILGRNYLGFTVAASLAVSWSFFQKIFNYIIFYGFNIVEIYKSLMDYLEKLLQLNFESLWIPLIILFSIYATTGFIAAIIGIKTAKRIQNNPIKFDKNNYNLNIQVEEENKQSAFPYSIWWLIINVLFIISALILINFAHYAVWIIFILLITAVWIKRYKRALKQLSRPKFWVFFAVITMLAAIVFTLLQSKTIFEAIMIGVEMNFRATAMILGFSVIGTELYNPVIRKYFSKSNFQQLPLALELSAESLPFIVANLPEGKEIFENPYKLLSKLISYSEYRFENLNSSKVQIISGRKDSGKTSRALKLIESFDKDKISYTGVLSLKVFNGDEFIGYDIRLLPDKIDLDFLRINDENSENSIGKFKINQASLDLGKKHILDKLKEGKYSKIIIDEVGRLELDNKGWDNEVRLALKSNLSTILVVREDFVEEVKNKYGI